MTVEPIVVTGTVVTYDDEQPVVHDGAVYVGADGIDRRRPAAAPTAAGRLRAGPPGRAPAASSRRGSSTSTTTSPTTRCRCGRRRATAVHAAATSGRGAATYGRDVSNPAQALGIAAAAADAPVRRGARPPPAG